jgi:hypothetical protein
MTVYVLIYDHDHGTDVSVHATDAMAQEARGEIVARWCDDLADETITKKIRAALDKGHWATAYHLYEDACQGQERMTIETTSVQGAEAPDGFRVVEVDSNLVHLVLTWPSGHEPGETRCEQAYHWPGFNHDDYKEWGALVAWVPKEDQVTTCLACLSDAP